MDNRFFKLQKTQKIIPQKIQNCVMHNNNNGDSRKK